MIPQGLAHFPGVNQVQEAMISFVHGVSPSIATLTIVPQANFIAEGGTLSFTFGGVRVDFPDCLVNHNSLQRNAAGEVWQLSIFDRRWKWTPWGGGGQISGAYNVRLPNSTIMPGTEKTPRELAELCLKAMGETGYNVGAIPNQARPEVNWDYALPAESLARLCDDLGCRVVLGLDNRVRICVAGTGANLPLDGATENSLTIDPPEMPEKIAIVTGPVRHQADFELEAVGLDRGTDLTKWPAQDVRVIDELSYKPVGGWGGTSPPYFGTETREREVRELAQSTVFKWYRVKCSATNPLTIPGYPQKITKLEQLNFENSQVATVLWQDSGVDMCLPPMVYGSWFDGRYGLANITNTINPDAPENDLSRREFTFDAAHGIVKFADPIFKNTTAAQSKLSIGPATLRLRVACTINNPQTRALSRYERERRTGTRAKTKTRYLRHDEISPSIIPTYNSSFKVTKLTHNKAAVDRECDYYLDAAMREYQLKLPQTITYSGLRKIDLDGAIHQITLMVSSNSGANTIVSRNTEQFRYTQPYKERRNRERTREQAAAAGNIVRAVWNVVAWVKEKVGR